MLNYYFNFFLVYKIVQFFLSDASDQYYLRIRAIHTKKTHIVNTTRILAKINLPKKVQQSPFFYIYQKTTTKFSKVVQNCTSIPPKKRKIEGSNMFQRNNFATQFPKLRSLQNS